jgi:hypothetical protein
MSDDNIDSEKLNPSFHDLINQPDMAGLINPDKKLNPTLEDVIYKVEPPPKEENQAPAKAQSSNNQSIRTISIIIKILAVVLGIFGIGLFINTLANINNSLVTIVETRTTYILKAIVSLVVFLIVSIVIYLGGELVKRIK